jgi:hypothetical protein
MAAVKFDGNLILTISLVIISLELRCCPGKLSIYPPNCNSFQRVLNTLTALRHYAHYWAVRDYTMSQHISLPTAIVLRGCVPL